MMAMMTDIMSVLTPAVSFKWTQPINRHASHALLHTTQTHSAYTALAPCIAFLSKLCPRLSPVRRNLFYLRCCNKQDVAVLYLGTKRQSESTTGAYLVLRKEASSTRLISFCSLL
ncbi:hypothetical protein AAHA92_30216 [Salvia divinorum]|uniref:Uncharacterized protein n=1 Tax=Salvia divinorum TaxID=28513 RepID=A0ABD1G3U8_SALDI